MQGVLPREHRCFATVSRSLLAHIAFWDCHPKGLEPKGSRVTDMGFVSGSPETVLQPRWSTFLVRTSFLSPKGAGLWTVDWQFQKSGFPAIYRKQAMTRPHALGRRDGRYHVVMPHMHCLIFCVFQVCVPSLC